MKKNRSVDKLYKTIANAQKKLEEIRKNCKHKTTRIGNYSWRIGAIDTAELCNRCDAVIPNNDTVFGGVQTNKITITSDGNNTVVNRLGGSGK